MYTMFHVHVNCPSGHAETERRQPMQPEQSEQPTQTTVHRVTSPAGDPAWRVRGYETIRQLLTDPRLGRSHPDPENASRYSEAVMFGRPMASSAHEQEEHAA